MTINDFIKECKKLFGDDIEYKVTTKDGIVFKQTKGWRDDKVVANQRQLANASGEVKST
jgi:hypothetical protein